MNLIEFDDIGPVLFDVDQQARTMRALVAPWGKVGRHADGRRWRFARGSLKYGHVKFLRLNDEHVQSARIGRAIAGDDTDAGLVLTFRIYDGPAGDEALALAADGSKTGFSPEIEFDAGDSQPDPENPGVRLVNLAHMTGVGFVERPAFDDARLISMRANIHDGKGAGMDPDTKDPDTKPDTDPDNGPDTKPDDAPDPTPVTFSADQFDKLMSKLGSADGPAVVDPTGGPRGQRAEVREPLPYTFSYEPARTGVAAKYHFSTTAEHDFSTDLFAMMRARQHGGMAPDAEKRVDALIKAAFADVESDDLTGIRPNRYRPDMWMPQMDYATPLWDMINSGPTDGTKFDVPKYNSSSGLVSAATEKVEPAGGAFTVTSQTITPTQVWGKVEITRQAWRAGGSPQLSGILWEQMLREYYEDREAAVATFLNTLTAAADITLTGTPASSPDNDDDQATVNDLEMAISDLQFVRGGNRFRAFAVHQQLWRVLARVKDDAGRPLYPMLNPMNANGTAQSLFSLINIAGTTAVPAWALGSPGTSAVNSWLFDPAKVRGWAGAPERLFWDFGATVQTANIPQLSFVTLGIYGDIALANLDINGVRQVIFDASV